MPVSTQSLIRKQYLVSQRNVSKLERLAKRKRTSATAIVLEAIEAYDPEELDLVGEQELMTLVSTRLKDAIKDTESTRKKLNKTLKSMGKNNGWLEGAFT